MTLRATREGDNIKISATYGTAAFEISEPAGHVGKFWGELGNLLRDEEKPWLKTEPAAGVQVDLDGLARVMREALGEEP